MSDNNIHAGLPIIEDDATIEAALEDVSIPTLVLLPQEERLLEEESR